MTTYGRTRDGHTIDDALIENLAANAEAGFPGAAFRPHTGGRQPLGASAARTRTIRIPPELDEALTARAERDHTTPSDIVRQALIELLAA